MGKKKKKKKTIAAIIHPGGWMIGMTETALLGGAPVCVGEWVHGRFHQLGFGRISRAKKWLSADNIAFADYYDVNTGGGPPE